MRLPQKCPGCEVSLRDKTAPRSIRMDPTLRRLFTRAETPVELLPSGRDETGRRVWVCPDCDHRWTTF